MEQFQEFRSFAKQKIKIADHMLNITYPLVKDSRLLLSIIENTFLSMSYSISSVLHYEQTFKKIPPFPDNFVNKLNVFKQKCAPKYKVENDHLSLVSTLRNILLAHKKSPVEFARKEAFVICTSDYKMKKITPEILKGYISKAKVFIDHCSNITTKNERIFS